MAEICNDCSKCANYSGTAKTFYFGGNNRNNPKSSMNGYLLEVMIWTRALNQSEINGTEAYIKQHWNI